MTDWNDPEINPLGLSHIYQSDARPMRLLLPVEARVLAYFQSKDGPIFVCAFIDKGRTREVYVQTEDGFMKVHDQDIQFTIARMTDEIIEKQRS
jgi:hypothetical protein